MAYAVELLVGLGASLLLLWLVLLAVLWQAKPEDATIRDTLRLVPDVIRLVRRLAADRTLPRPLRARLVLGLGYLLLPIDLVPDFLPVIGYADDAIVVALLLRSVIRTAGNEALAAHWPGTPEGLAAVSRLAGITPATGSPDNGGRLLTRGVRLESVTLGWNVIGIVILAIAAITARSVALAGFGLDSFIEIGASTVVLWELSGAGEERQRRALRLIGVAFVVLAIYLGIQSTYVLAIGHHPATSALGIIWTATTATVMFGLAAGKARTGLALDNPVLRTEGRVTMIDGLLAAAVLAGLVLNAALGWWWADPMAGYVILFYGLKEGFAALKG